MIVDKGKDYRQKDVRVIIKPTISGKFLNNCIDCSLTENKHFKDGFVFSL